MADRPEWCPFQSCTPCAVLGQGKLCSGKLPEPEEHGGDFNTHRFCMRSHSDDLPEWTFHIQINRSDAYQMRLVLGAPFGMI